MGGFVQDLRYGTRIFLRNPGFTAVAALTLALGIGACTSVFSVVDAVLLRPLPYEEPERLVLLWQHSGQMAGMMVSYPDYLDWREQNRVFEEIGVFNRSKSLNLTGMDAPERIPTAMVTASFFKTLRVRPERGRLFLPSEDRVGGDRVVLLSQAFWERRFGSDPAIVGRTLTLDGHAYAVVGILPEEFHLPSNAEIWVPLGLFVDAGMLSRGNHPGLLGIARLKPGVTLATARAGMDTIARRLQKQYPDTNTDIGVSLNSLREQSIGDFRTVLWALLGSVGCVLLIACANVASLLMARAAARSKEIAVRGALGASRLRLLRQLLCESLILSLAGGSAGLLLAWWGADLLRTFGAGIIPRAGVIAIDPRVLAAALSISVATGVIFGLAPALQASRVGVSEALKEGGGWSLTGGRGRRRFRSLVVVAEVAVSLMLLIGAGLMINSFVRLLSVRPGFNSRNILTAVVSLPPAKYPDGAPVAAFYDRVLEKIRGLPGVRAAAAVDPLPFGEGGWQAGLLIEGYQPPPPDRNALIDAAVVTPDYFRVMGIPRKRGRDFSDQDGEGKPGVAVVNEAFVRRFWPRQDPLGRRIRFDGPGDAPWCTVVGVVGDVKRVSLESPERPEIYLPFGQHPGRTMSLVARTASPPAGLAPALRGAVLAVDREQPLYAVATMRELLAASLAERRFSMLLMALFAGVALALASVGIYGVVSYAVSQRTREFGVRMALGAGRRDILRLVLAQGMTLALLGVGLGLAGSLAATRCLASLLFGVTPTDPSTFVGVSALLAGVTLAACYLPARRAMRVDPMVTLRCE